MPTETGGVDEIPLDEMGQPLEAADSEHSAHAPKPMQMPSSLHE